MGLCLKMYSLDPPILAIHAPATASSNRSLAVRMVTSLEAPMTQAQCRSSILSTRIGRSPSPPTPTIDHSAYQPKDKALVMYP